MAHVLHRVTRRMETSLKRHRTSRRLEAALRDPHLAKDIGLPTIPNAVRKPELW